MPSAPPSSAGSSPRWVLRRRDQAAVAAIALVMLVATPIAWWRAGGAAGLVEIDDQPRRELHFVVAINQAPWMEIAQLPSVGETLAKRIVADRNAHGPYGSPADLRRVPGIGPKTLEKMTPFLRFEDP